jgi:hypothetical protein
MLTAKEAARLTGLSYEICLELLKAHGKKIRDRWYITTEKLKEVLACE